MAPDWTFRVQNRSHFVNASTHTQFKGLDTWLERHRADLMAILGEPGQRILFGEFAFVVFCHHLIDGLQVVVCAALYPVHTPSGLLSRL
jgi:hypothetical protein